MISLFIFDIKTVVHNKIHIIVIHIGYIYIYIYIYIHLYTVKYLLHVHFIRGHNFNP